MIMKAFFNATPRKNKPHNNTTIKQPNSNMSDIEILTSKIQIMTASHGAWHSAVIFVMALTAFLGVIYFVISKIESDKARDINENKDELIRLKDNEQTLQITKVKTDSEEHIAYVKAEAEKQIIIINEKAEESRVNQRELERENLKLQGEVAKLQTKAADSQRELLELQERTKPRHLTDEQRIKLIDLLKQQPKGTIEIECIAGDKESCDFARQISDMLSFVGWKITSLGSLVIGGQPPSGLLIFFKDAMSTPTGAKALQEALLSVGFPALGQLHSEYPQDKLTLMVGVKP
jgi:hypothetical protein